MEGFKLSRIEEYEGKNTAVQFGMRFLVVV